jgi:CheY-like chemotaxis protein
VAAPLTSSVARRILLAEDNRVNQRLALFLLEKMGHSVVVAENGKQAVAAHSRERFELILMDVQMPEMNGYEATAMIRESEKATGQRIPIVAMTAHAMTGDRERCLTAGMDDYVSKPVDAALLAQKIAELTDAAAPAAPDPKASQESSSVNRAHALARVEGDQVLLRQLIDLFLEDWPRIRNEIAAALARGDVEAVADSAHALKGAVGVFGAPRAEEIVRRLEGTARKGDRASAERAFRETQAELLRVCASLQRLRAA